MTANWIISIFLPHSRILQNLFACVCVCVCEWKTLLIQKRILRQFKFVSQSDRRKMPAGYFEEKKNARSCNPGTRLFTHQKKFFRGCRISPAAYQSYAVIGSTHAQQERKPFFLINQSTLRSFFLFYSLASSQLLWNRKKKFSFTSCYFLFFLILLLVG